MALGAEPVTTTVEGRERYTVSIRYPRDYRSDPQAIATEVLIPMADGGTVPLGQVAKVSLAQGPASIRTENSQLAAYIFVDLRDRDLGGYVADAQKAVAQFEYLERAKARLKVVVPVTVLIRFIGSLREAVMMGKCTALLDLRTLKDQPHLYGIGPIEGLVGEATIANGRPALARVGADRLVHVTESYEGGMPFFVWAEVAVWQTVKVPPDVRTFRDLETFVGDAGAKAGLTQAFPFVVTGKPDLIDFHIVDAKPDTPSGMADHEKIQIPFEVHRQEATFKDLLSRISC